MSSNIFALSLTNNKYFGSKTTYRIDLFDQYQLQAVLSKELNFQRQNNFELKQLSDINRISRLERSLLMERLRAEGYYAAKIDVSIEGINTTYSVRAGPLYVVKKVSIQVQKDIVIPLETVVIKSGSPLLAESVLKSKDALVEHISNHFCLYSINVRYRVLMNHQSAGAEVVFVVDESPSVVFGEITFSGITTLQERFLFERLPFQQGECFKRKQIDKAKILLLRTDLISSIDTKVLDIKHASVPIKISVVERRHRTNSAGVGYETDEGFGVSAGWEHRSLFGRGQNFKINTHLSEITQTLSTSFTIPHYKKKNQTLGFYSSLVNEDSDSFHSKTGTFGVELSHPIRNKMRGKIGLDLAFSRVEEDDQENDFALLSIPFGLEFDRRDQTLDPRKGWVLAGQFRPYWNVYNNQELESKNSLESFLKATLASSIYLPLDKLYLRPVVAFRLAFGSIIGADRESIPANIRMYAGGGGSVRGYAFRSVGSITDKEADGGLAFMELSGEVRFRWNEQWGSVLFVDSGYAYESSSPHWGQSLLMGAGLGVRYFTSFAPVRFDVAVPIDKREGDEFTDDSYQLYISIGQAF